eukprot:767585-Hanusia_phi.AAC.4
MSSLSSCSLRPSTSSHWLESARGSCILRCPPVASLLLGVSPPPLFRFSRVPVVPARISQQAAAKQIFHPSAILYRYLPLTCSARNASRSSSAFLAASSAFFAALLPAAGAFLGPILRSAH